ncbi:MAG TPA: DegT/DnrJ/EryC1/StrS aminotransferase family protein, partial [Rhodoglobus sp.]|nr:DegT/DnrJ/EryC1/StrS aminotransferase family protein [Rhodoglobus sp.]
MIPAARPEIGDEERAAVDRVMRSGMLAQGPEVAAFESEFSAIVNGMHSIAVNSGTSALHMAFLAAGVGAGDEVIVPSFSFAATANSVALAGATPVFVDIELDHFNAAPAAIEAAITPRTKAIMPVHLYGHPADLVAIKAIADKHGLLLFEDAAQAHAASVDGVPVGAWGIAASFSFYPTKNMTSGEGGMITTPSEEVARMSRVLRNQGMERRYENEVVGFNTRMTDIHAAIGRVQLTKLAGWTAKRQA